MHLCFFLPFQNAILAKLNKFRNTQSENTLHYFVVDSHSYYNCQQCASLAKGSQGSRRSRGGGGGSQYYNLPII